jgi:hypothetical protein
VFEQLDTPAIFAISGTLMRPRLESQRAEGMAVFHGSLPPHSLILFIFGLFNDAVSVPDHTASSGRRLVSIEECRRKEGINCALIFGTVPVFNSRRRS